MKPDKVSNFLSENEIGMETFDRAGNPTPGPVSFNPSEYLRQYEQKIVFVLIMALLVDLFYLSKLV